MNGPLLRNPKAIVLLAGLVLILPAFTPAWTAEGSAASPLTIPSDFVNSAPNQGTVVPREAIGGKAEAALVTFYRTELECVDLRAAVELPGVGHEVLLAGAHFVLAVGKDVALVFSGGSSEVAVKVVEKVEMGATVVDAALLVSEHVAKTAAAANQKDMGGVWNEAEWTVRGLPVELVADEAMKLVPGLRTLYTGGKLVVALHADDAAERARLERDSHALLQRLLRNSPDFQAKVQRTMAVIDSVTDSGLRDEYRRVFLGMVQHLALLAAQEAALDVWLEGNMANFRVDLHDIAGHPMEGTLMNYGVPLAPSVAALSAQGVEARERGAIEDSKLAAYARELLSQSGPGWPAPSETERRVREVASRLERLGVADSRDAFVRARHRIPAEEATYDYLAKVFGSPRGARRGDLDMIAIVDASGSMRKNDPDNLRRQALTMMLDRLGRRDRLGVVLFTDRGRVVAHPQTLGRANSPVRLALRKGISAIGAGGGTNIGDALNQAVPLVADDRDTAAILLSDGQDGEGWQGENPLPPHVPVHTIALSSDAALPPLAAISGASGGIHEVARDSSELHRIFDNLFSASAQLETILMWEKLMTTGQTESVSFFVEPDAGELEMTLAWPGSTASLRLEDPNGRVLSVDDAVKAGQGVREATYCLASVPSPAPGEWKAVVHADEMDPGGEVVSLRATTRESKVWTMWRLSWAAPEVGLPVSLRLKTGGAPVTWKTVQWSLRSPDGHVESEESALASWTAKPVQQGSTEEQLTVWSMLPRDQGVYRLTLKVEGALQGGVPIHRCYDQSFSIRPRGGGVQYQYEIPSLIPRRR